MSFELVETVYSNYKEKMKHLQLLRFNHVSYQSGSNCALSIFKTKKEMKVMCIFLNKAI